MPSDREMKGTEPGHCTQDLLLAGAAMVPHWVRTCSTEHKSYNVVDLLICPTRTFAHPEESILASIHPPTTETLPSLRKVLEKSLPSCHGTSSGVKHSLEILNAIPCHMPFWLALL